ncbi:catalase [Streptomyces capillispiralis]|uniref:catalase n=1 Tax=Streptomyces capillispiralis TaxID=68182 RepID=UPI0036BC55B7
MTQGPLTTRADVPVADDQHREPAGGGTLVLVHDQLRAERWMPGRAVRARGAGARGTFRVTADVTRYTRAGFLSEKGKETEVFLRFSAAGRRGPGETAGDLPVVTVRLCTEEGDHEVVGNDDPYTYQWDNEAGQAFWVKYHFRTGRDTHNPTTDGAGVLADGGPGPRRRDPREATGRGGPLPWTVGVQIMPMTDCAGPFDLARAWPRADYPVIEIGELELGCPPDTAAGAGRSTIGPARSVPCTGPAPGGTPRGRLIAFGGLRGASGQEPGGSGGPARLVRPLWQALTPAAGETAAPVRDGGRGLVRADGSRRPVPRDGRSA